VAPQPVYVAQGYVPIGTQFAVLPSGAQSMIVNGVNYYQRGPTWYKPYFGSSGVYYEGSAGTVRPQWPGCKQITRGEEPARLFTPPGCRPAH
jgi:hypothetical protein